MEEAECLRLPGFSKVLSSSGDVYCANREENKLHSDFQADKICLRINDPDIAEKLIPKNHGFGSRQVPLESGYYEALNRSNVRLVDLTESPIEWITDKDIKKREEEFEFDIAFYATGFDAVTGSVKAVDFHRAGRTRLSDVWSEGIRTFFGMTVKGFPNMFMYHDNGTLQIFGNNPRIIEYAAK
ncbi:phenylacetone monooxygenase [Colletotrichum graminicola M1.001]|uniref:Phenylacetone monooxygenase n=1 Tax=Colletotrichum graminicola (strain M1.001 / M2 / FGSC 10212) TaxID=645133 RepID=E3Q932_COLGM|nr:phenylacetone monooxygenase [Colletotrichum graminicola M1.001]EFQ27211.1 phenylacetone monooxygenase [Colletotrichum graminicola M1.001]